MTEEEVAVRMYQEAFYEHLNLQRMLLRMIGRQGILYNAAYVMRVQNELRPLMLGWREWTELCAAYLKSRGWAVRPRKQQTSEMCYGW